jgi:Peptidase family C25
MHRRMIHLVVLAVLVGSLPAASPVRAAVHSPLAVRVTQAGVVTVTDAQLAAAGWPLPLARDHVILRRHGQALPLTDTGSGFAFIGLPSDSRWSREAVYWLSLSDAPAPRASILNRLLSPLTSEPEVLYARHQATARGDSWWAGELRGSQALSATLALPDPIPAGTPLQLVLRSTQPGSNHAVAVAVGGQPSGIVTWSDGPAPPQVVTQTVSLPARPAGPLRVDLTLASGGDTILVDGLALPTVFPPANPVAVSDPVSAVALPGNLAGASLLIITHSAFRPALDPLIATHARLGRRVAVVDVQAAYDAFSFGERDPEAIRSLIRQVRPGAVLLVGAGTTALRQEAPARPTFIPPYLIRSAQDGETACDTCYARLNGGDPAGQILPDIPIGRFPVTTLAEAQTLVTKTVTHVTAPPAGAWQSQALFLADNDYQADGTPDPAGSFVQTAETGISVLPRGIQVSRFYYAPDRAPAGAYDSDVGRLRCRLFRAIDGGSKHDTHCAQNPPGAETGAALFMYVGHGSPWQWAYTTPDAPTAYLWYLYDADARKNGDRLPILLTMTCLSGDFANPVLQTNDERLLLWPNGGIVASVSSSGEGVNTGHARLLRGMLARLYAAAGDRTLGAAHLAGLNSLQGTTPDLAFAFSVLGDPLVVAPFVPVSSVNLPLIVR